MKKSRILPLALAAATMLVALAPSLAAQSDATSLKGKSLQIDGSSALQPFFLNAAKYFDQGMKTNTTAVVNGSGNGLTDPATKQ
ncbi:MAG TPA: hypothetical protein VMV90_07335 [Rectinemataceae bacterium]|nr:hypothetical protein [Rectinemataceae bacterium]